MKIQGLMLQGAGEFPIEFERTSLNTTEGDMTMVFVKIAGSPHRVRIISGQTALERFAQVRERVAPLVFGLNAVGEAECSETELRELLDLVEHMFW